MFGSGIGELNVYIRPIGGSQGDRKIWALNGDAGNNWYMAQAPVASAKPFKVTKKPRNIFTKLTLTIFQIVFEGIVGKNSLGNIAIDDVSVAPGVCPSKQFLMTFL